MSELLFSSKKAQKVLEESLSQVPRPGKILEIHEGNALFHIDYSGVLFFEIDNEFERIVLFQLLRFSEILDLDSLMRMSWREFENFMRDNNINPAIKAEKAYSAEREYNQIKQKLNAPLKALKGLELQQQKYSSVEGKNFIECCAMFQELCDDLVRLKIITNAVRPHSWEMKAKKLLWELDPGMTSNRHEIETLIAVSKQIQGVKDVKMVARA